MTDAGQWTVDMLPVDYGLSGVWVDADGSAIVVGSFAMLCRKGRGPWVRATVRGKPQHMAIAGEGSLRIAVGYPHSCVVSNDGGARWQNRAVGAKRQLDSIACMSERRIFVAGEDGAYVSSDAGKTFAYAGDMRRVALAETGVFAVSRDWNPVLHVWDDVKSSWRAIAAMPERSSALAAAGDVLISVGSGVHRSCDAGTTWTEAMPHREGVYLVGVAANPTGRVVVVGYGGLIAISEDFGVTWHEHRPTSRDLRGVWLAPDEEIWAVGDDGALVRSGADPAGEVVAPAVQLTRDDGVVVGAVLRPAAPVPAWSAPDPAGAPVHTAPVIAAAFLDDAHAVTGDGAGRLARLSRGPDGRWASEITELGEAITGLAALGEAVFAIVDGRLVRVGNPHRIATSGKVTRLAARSNRLAAGGPKCVTTWTVKDGVLGKPVELEVAGELVDLDISPDGTQLVIVIGDRVFAHDAATGKASGSFRRKGARVRFTRTGTQLYLVSDSYDLAVVSVAKGGGRDKIQTGNRHWMVATSPHAATIATLSHADELDVIDVATGAILLGWKASEEATLCGTPRQAATRPPMFGQHRLPIPHHVAITALAVSDGGSVVAGDVTGEVAIFDAQRLEQQRAETPRAARIQPALDPPLIDVGVVACGPTDDGHALFLGVDQRLRVVDPDTGEVRAGPRIDITNVVSLHALGDVVLAATTDGWIGIDRRTGARRWSTSFPVRKPVAHRGAMYGFEHRSSYPVGERTNHRLYRLDPATGAVTEVTLAPPPRADRTDGYSYALTATATGLLAVFVHADGTMSSVRLDVASGTAVDLPRGIEHQGVIVDPSGRYVMWPRDGCEIRDTADPSWPIVARPTSSFGDALPIVDAGLIVSIDSSCNQLQFRDLDGALVRSIGGIVALGTTSLFATPRGAAIVTWSGADAVRRWPAPSPASNT